MTPLRVADFRLLEPGTGFEPTRSAGGAAYLLLAAFNNFFPAVPGRYELWLTPSTRSANDEEWRVSRNSAEGEMAFSLLAEMPRLKVQSDVVTVEVR